MKSQFRVFRPQPLLSLLLCLSALPTAYVSAQELATQPSSTQVVIDAEILAAFVDEPCHHFEAAKRAFVRGDNQQAADHLETASAFLQLELARATGDAKRPLGTSIRELRQLSGLVENGQIGSTERLENAFARAHFALAGHHCVQSAHWCCRSDCFKNRHNVQHAGHDLKAATVHLKRASVWSKADSDHDASKALESAQSSAEQMIRLGAVPQTRFVQTINSVRGRLEDLTGRKIMLAPPLMENDNMGPSIFR